MRFKNGDRVIQNINGTWITATVVEDRGEGTVYCIWDDDHDECGTDAETLILLDVYNSPLFKALL